MRRSGQSSRRGESRNHSKARLLLCSAASLAAAHLAGNSALAASGTWNQASGGSYDFVDPANWLGGNVPGGADAIFDMSRLNTSGGFNITLNSNRTIGQLLVSDLDISSTTNVNFGGTGILTLSTTVGGPILNIGSLGVIGNNFVQIDNVIAGNQGLEKQGTGTLTFTGVNTYSGTTTITAGTLRVLSASGLGSSTVLLNGGGLELRNDNATNFGVGITLAVSSTLTVDNNTGGSGLTHTIGAVNFGAAGAKTLTITSANSFGLNTGAVTLSDVSTVTNNSGGLVTLASVNSTAAAAATLNLAGTGSVTVSGAITQGAGALTIANTSNHMVTLNGALSNTGGVAVTGGGTTLLGSGVSLPSGAPVSVTNGVLDLGNNSSTAGAITMGGNSGTILTGTGTLTLGGDVTFNTGAGSANIVGNLNLGATPRTFNIALGTSGSWDMVVNGPIGDSGGGFVKTGAGRLRLTGNNSSTGQVTVNAGTLQADALASGSTLGSGTLAIGGGTLLFQNLSGAAAAGSTGTLVFGGTNSTGTLSINANGQGTTTLNLTAIGGRTAASTGVLNIVPTTGALGGSEILTVTNAPTGSLLVNGMLPAYMTQQPGGNDNAIDFLTVTGNQVIGATYTNDINAGATALVAPDTDADISSATKTVFALKLNSHTVNGSGGTLIIGDNTNPAGLILNGGSTINVSNLKFGSTGGSEGIIWASGGTGNITSAITLANTLTTAGSQGVNFSGPITFGNSSANFNVDGATVTLSGTLVSGDLVKQGPGTLVLPANYSAFVGSITANNGTVQIGDGGSDGTLSSTSKLITNSAIAFNRNDAVSISNAISGTGSVAQNGSGTLTLTGPLAYTGSTIANTGVLQISANDQLPVGNPLVVNGSGTFAMNGKNQTVNALNNATATGGTITNNGTTLSTLTITGSGSFNGVVQNGTGSVALVKNTGGNQTFTGANTFTGGTQINGATITLGSGGTTGSLGTGTITFNGGTLASGMNDGNSITIANPIALATGSTGTIVLGNRAELHGAVTGDAASTLNILTPSSVDRSDFRDSFAAFNGTLNLSGGNVSSPGQARFRVNQTAPAFNGAGLVNTSLNLDNVRIQVVTNSGGNTIEIGALSGTSTAILGGTDNSTAGGPTYRVGMKAGIASSQFAGSIQNAGGGGGTAFTKVGAGTLVLSGTSGYTGNTVVGGTGAGTLAPGGALRLTGLLTGTPNITVNNGATFAFGTGGNITGATTLTLNSTAALDVATATGYSTPAGLTIIGTSTAGAAPKIYGAYNHGGGTINPGAVNGAGTVVFNNGLTFAGGTGALDLSATNTALGGGTNDLISVTGDLTLNPSTLRFNFLSGTPASGATYTIMQYTGNTNVPNGTISGWNLLSGLRGSFTLANDLANKQIKVTVTPNGSAQFLTWTGVQGLSWDVATSANWKSQAGTGTLYFQNDAAAFLDEGSGNVITVNSALSPSALLVNASKSYQFNGTGGFIGTMALVKDGSGTLTITTAANANTYTGGTQLKNGAIDINNAASLANSLGTGSIQMSNNTYLTMTGFTGSNAGDRGDLSNAIILDAGANTTINLTQRGRLAGTLTGDANSTLNLVVPFIRGDISGDWSGYNGTINATLGAGTTEELRFPNINGLPNATLVLNNGVSLSVPNSVANFGTLGYGMAIGELRGAGTLSSGTATGNFTWRIGRNTDFQFDGAIVNNVSTTSITKQGTSTWTLDGQNTYTGTTTINGGTMKLDNGGALSSPIIIVNNGGTFAIGGGGGNFTSTTSRLVLNQGGAFDVTAQNPYNTNSNLIISGAGGTVFGNVNHNAGTIDPGTTEATVGTINFHDDLNLNGGVSLFDLNTSTAVGSGTNDLVNVASTGTLDLNTGTIIANFLTAPTAGTDYTLFTYTNKTGNISNLNLASRANATLNDTGSAIMLHINSFTTGALVWKGNQSNVWDVGLTQNWDNGGTPDKFFQSDNTTFNDTANNFTVQINSYVVSPSSVVFENTNNQYTLQGTGTITGATSLVKNGSSTLTISNQNNYTGGTTINAGTVAVRSAQPFTGTATLNNAAIAVVQPTANTAFGWGNAATVNVPAGSSGTISSIGDTSTSGGTLDTLSTFTNGTLTGGGIVNYLATNVDGSPVASAIDVNSNLSAFTGTVNFQNNGPQVTMRLSAAAGTATAFYNLGNTGTLAANGTGNYVFGALTGGSGSTLKGFEGISGNAAGGAVTYQIGSLNVDTTYSGAIVDGTGTSGSQVTAVTKFGTAKLTLNGTSTFTGPLTLSGGTVALGATGSVATPTIVFSGGALDVTAAGYTGTSKTFTGTGTVFGNVTHTAGTLIPATSGTAGTLAFANNYSTNAGTLNVDLAQTGAIGNGTNDLVDVTGQLSLTGTSNVNVNFLQVPTVGSYPFLRYGTKTGAGTLALASLGIRGTASLDFSQANQVNLAITSVGGLALTWRGTGNSGAWDLTTATNWTVPAGTADKFFQFDSVTFNETTGAPNTVNIATAVSPSSIVVNSSGGGTFNYTFNGAGKITGPGSLTKSGTSTLTINTVNDYVGGTTVNGGTINVGSLGSSALGGGSINLNGGAVTSTGTGTVFFSTRVNAAAGATSTLAINGTGAVGNINGNLTGTGTVNLISDNTGKLFDLGGSNTTFGGTVVLVGTQTIRLGGTGGSGAAVWSLPGGGTLSSNAGTTAFTTTEFLGALNGAATSTLYGYRAGGTGGNIAYQVGDANVNGAFAGNVVDGISGATVRPVSIIKSGTAKQTFSGSNSYTGGTQVNSGTLAFVGPNAWGPALSGTSVSTTGGSVLNGGRMVLDYTGNVPADPASQINTILSAGAAGNFLVGQLRTTNAVDGRHGIGWIDTAPTVTVGYTWLGDANVDGMVTTGDFNALAMHFNNSSLATPGSPVWAEGDFNYDGHVNALDFNMVASDFGATPIPSAPLGSNALGTLVPEPASLGMIGLIGTALLGRRRRRA